MLLQAPLYLRTSRRYRNVLLLLLLLLLYHKRDGLLLTEYSELLVIVYGTVSGNQQEDWSSQIEVRRRFVGPSSSRVVGTYRKSTSVSVTNRHRTASTRWHLGPGSGEQHGDRLRDTTRTIGRSELSEKRRLRCCESFTTSLTRLQRLHLVTLSPN